ncbi:MAG: hypothetical protein JXO44_12970, partial [Clostridia bacterium]|nr:hypothetical protein [Clostridia bacterium]
MTVTPRDYLDSALEMSAGQNEITLRNAVSRFYYGAYHVCLEFADHQNLGHPDCNNKPSSHENLICRMRKSRITGIESIVRLFDICKKRRVKADYKLKQTISKEDEENQRIDCFRILQKVTNLTNTIEDD